MPVTPIEVTPLRTPLLILLAGALVTAALIPFDGPVAASLDAFRFPGDIRREWAALQQFGQGASIVLICIIILVQDPLRRHLLLRFGAALAAVGLVVTACKLFIGRPRPRFGDSTTFLFPWGTYPVPIKHPVDGGPLAVDTHAWNLSFDAVEQLWSMPSSHTAFAAVTALFLATLYPRLTALWAVLAVIVASGRLVFDAHWPSDVSAGATLALALAWPIIRGGPKLASFPAPGPVPSGPSPSTHP